MRDLLDSEISDEKVSEILYQGSWEKIKVLKENPKFHGYDKEVWKDMAKDYEFNWAPWKPVLIVLSIMFLNLFLRLYQQSISALFAAIGIAYISYVIPLINRSNEARRISRVDLLLDGSPFHRSKHPSLDHKIEKKIKELSKPKDIRKNPALEDDSIEEEVVVVEETTPEQPLKKK